MVWSDLNPIQNDENDTIITLHMRSLDISSLSNTLKLELYEMSEFTDMDLSTIEGVVLEIPEIRYPLPDPADTISGYYVKVYPNPFNFYTTVDITLKEESNISMSVHNPEGKKVRDWGEKIYPEGNSLIRVYEAELSKGVYFLKVKISNPGFSSTRLFKIFPIE
jgi:hypothetical protein